MVAEWILDPGHSRIKWARTNGPGRLIDLGQCPIDDISALERRWQHGRGERVLASGQARSRTLARLRSLADACGMQLQVIATGDLDLPVRSSYPGLGCDRWLAVQWPWQQCRQALCVIDCGTAVTIDLVDATGCHRGGWIMPGLETARAGLLERAPGLPRESASPDGADQPALDSAQAIARGTLLQMAGAVERGLAAAKAALGPNPQVWMTGGDAAVIMRLTRIEATLDEHLVLRGLAMAKE